MTHFFVCTNERPDGSVLPCCSRRGGAALLDAFRAEHARRGFPRGIKVSGATCLTTCQHGPTVVVYPAALWYGNVSPDDVGALLDAHLEDRAPLERLLLPADVTVW